jgi:hypothetical protein
MALTTGAMVVAINPTAAQNTGGTSGGLDKQMEVTRAYTPRVGQAEKLPVAPDMTDTVRMRPEISYRITSSASSTSFETVPYAAATVSEAPYSSSGPLYLKAGAGVPLQTVVDLYFTPEMRKTDRAFGLFANHAGSFSRIVNDLHVEAPATEMTNGAGLWTTRQWRRYSLEADATFDTRHYNPYGVADVDHTPESSAWQPRQFVFDRKMHRFNLGLARAGVSFGDNFSELNRLNFRLALDAGYGWGHNEDQFNIDARLTMARMFGPRGKHGFELVLAERGAFGSAFDHIAGDGDILSPGHAVTVSFMPRYVFASGVWDIKAGVDARYVINNACNQDYVRLTPAFEARAVLAGGALVPYVSYTSQIMDGDAEALSRRNPYVTTSGTTAWVNDARVGVEGDINDLFSYKIAGGASVFRDYQLFVGTQLISLRAIDNASEASYDPMWFTPLPVDGTRFTAGAELALKNLGGFGARLYGNLNKFEFSGTYASEPVGPRPDYDAGLELSYHYKDRFSLRAGAELIGQRHYLVRSNSSTSSAHRYHPRSIAPVVDVTFGADVRVAPDFWVFAEGENLADQVLYPYPHYRGLGASVVGGVKIVF